MLKTEIRRQLIGLRSKLTQAEREAACPKILQNIRSLECYQNARHIGMYAADATEVDLMALLQLDPGKMFYFPRYDAAQKCYQMVHVGAGSDLVPGKYNLLEPKPELSAADLAWTDEELLFLVPAVGCDLWGNRLGRGGGFYDRLLAGNRRPKIAVIFDCQLVKYELPALDHDITVDFAVTEKEIIKRRID